MSSQLPKSLRLQVSDAFRGDDGLVRCAMCSLPFPDKDIQIDHIKPEYLGGSHDLDNLQPLCYPRIGPSCHKDKSAAEAKARAKARRNDGRLPGILGAIVLMLLTGAVIVGRLAWLMWNGDDVQPLIETVQQTIKWYLILISALFAAYALAHVGIGESEKTRPKTKVGETMEQRIAAAVRAEMGTSGSIKVRARDGGHRVIYRGTDFPDHEPSKRLAVQRRLAAKLGRRQQLTWDTERDEFTVRPRPDLPAKVDHPGLPKVLPWHQIPIGTQTIINLKVTPHVLVIGLTLAGKTSLFRSIVIAAAHASQTQDVRSIIVDPKRVELIGFRGWPGVQRVITDTEEMYNLPDELVTEMERRYAAFEEQGIPLTSHQPWFVIIDEYHEYVKRMAAWSLETKKRSAKSSPIRPIEQIASLLAMARRCNIHFIIGTQRPDASWFGGESRDNCQCRIGVGPLSQDAARMLFADAAQGRDIPATAKGRFTIQVNEGGYREDQAFWVADPSDADNTNTPEDWALLERLGMPKREEKK